MLTLYHAHMSVCSQKVRVALCEKAQQWQDEFLNLARGDQFNSDYLALNPNALVPTLVHDGRALIESSLICEYLEDAFPDPPLAPADPYARYRMRLWKRRVDDRVHPATGTISFAMVLRHSRIDRPAAEQEAHLARIVDPARRERQRQTLALGVDAPGVREAAALFETLCADMEAQLEDTDWLAGDDFSLADIALIPYITRLERLRLGWMWDKRPHLTDWFLRVRQRPSYARAIEDYVTEAGAARYAEHAGEAARRVRALLSD